MKKSVKKIQLAVYCNVITTTWILKASPQISELLKKGSNLNASTNLAVSSVSVQINFSQGGQLNHKFFQQTAQDTCLPKGSLEKAVILSIRLIIGTNISQGPLRNPRVSTGCTRTRSTTLFFRVKVSWAADRNFMAALNTKRRTS